MSRRPFFFLFFPLFSVFFFLFLLFVSFFEKHVKIRYREQRACDTDAQEGSCPPAPSSPGGARAGTCRGTRGHWVRGRGVSAQFGRAWRRPVSAGDSSGVCGVPLRPPSPSPPALAPGRTPLRESTHRGERSGWPEPEVVLLCTFRLSVALSSLHRTQHALPGNSNRTATPNKATRCAPALSHRRAGRKKQVTKGQ